MKSIRIGNDIPISWRIRKDGNSFDLTDLDIRLYMKNIYHTKQVKDFTTEANVLSWTFRGADQEHLGTYSLILVINEGKDGMITTDVCKVFKLVSSSCKTGGNDDSDVATEPIILQSEVGIVTGDISIVVDPELSSTSTNPVENRVITSALESKADVSALEGKADKSELDAYQPKGDYLTEVPSDVLESIANKVDKVEGKGLSSNDYTDADKSKLSGLENYDDSALRTLVGGKVDKEAGKGLSSNDFTDAYKGALDGLDEALSGKQDVISDLDSIRSKANSALQEVPDGYVKEEDVATINGQSILNGGNIEIQGGEEGGLVGEVVSSTEPTDAFPQVLYIEQTLNEEQKGVARRNIGVDTYVAEAVADKVDATYVSNAIASAITNVLNEDV